MGYIDDEDFNEGFSSDQEYWDDVCFGDHDNDGMNYPEPEDTFETHIVNENSKNMKLVNPVVEVDNKKNVIVVWFEEKSNDDDDDKEEFNLDGSCNLVGCYFTLGDFKSYEYLLVNDTPDYCCSSELPKIVFQEDGSFIILWYESKKNECKLYAQIYSSDCKPVGSNLKINEDSTSVNSFSVTIDIAGNYNILWDGSFLYKQIISSSGNFIGINQKLNINTFNRDAYLLPLISINLKGNIIVVNCCNKDNKCFLIAETFDPSGNSISHVININRGSDKNRIENPSLSINSAGDFVISWHETFDNDKTSIYARCFSLDGKPKCKKIIVYHDLFREHAGEANSISIDNTGNFVVSWFSESDNYRIHNAYSSYFSSHGEIIEAKLKIDDNHYSPDVSSINVKYAHDAMYNVFVVYRDEKDKIFINIMDIDIDSRRERAYPHRGPFRRYNYD